MKNGIQKAMMDLYVERIKELGVRIHENNGYRLTIYVNKDKVLVYPSNESYYYKQKKYEGLGELLELIYTSKQYKIKNKTKTNIKYKGTYKCPNMEQYEALLKELGIYYDKHRSELTIMFEGYPVKIFPKRHWFTGKKVKDGRGIDNLRKELTKFYL